MKKFKGISVLLVSAVLMTQIAACSDTKETEKTTDTSAEVTTEAQSSETSDTEETSETSPIAETQEEKYDYRVFTDASNREVEAYALSVQQAIVDRDWDKVGNMIQYPIEMHDATCNNKQEFVEYMSGAEINEDWMAELEAWKIEDLWANSYGACLGNVWFQDVSLTGTDFKVISITGIDFNL